MLNLQSRTFLPEVKLPRYPISTAKGHSDRQATGGVSVDGTSIYLATVRGAWLGGGNPFIRSPALAPELAHFFNPFAVSELPEGFSAVSGTIQEFNPAIIQKIVSPTAARFAPCRDLIELYQDGERFWLHR